jgi:hypothetical protein
VKADAYYRWQPRKDDLYRVTILKHRHIEETDDRAAYDYDDLYTVDGEIYTLWCATDKYKFYGKNGDKVMVLEYLEETLQDYGRIFWYYKLMNLRTGEVYIQFTTDPTFTDKFNHPFGSLQ